MADPFDAVNIPAEEEVVEPQPPANLIDIKLLQEYIKAVCPVLLDAKPDAFQKVLFAPETQKVIEKFVADSKIPVLFIQKRIETTEADNDAGTYGFSLEIELSEDKPQIWIALIKKTPNSVLEASRSVAAQLQLVELGEGSPFETLHSLVRNSISPLVRSYLKLHNKEQEETKDVKSGIGMGAVNQKVAELELSLYNCKQNIEIPAIVLTYHPEVKAAAKKTQETQRPLTVEELGERVKDPNFLNALQAGVNVWIKDIHRVTKLERIEKMPPNTETIHEIKFWLELDVELNHIDKQLKENESECTLNILKQAKRFHATASFDTDTIGLKKAIEKVNNYKPLMKDFPINDLLASTEITQLSNALKAIFEHLKKTKNAHYPIPRYLQLVEAVSRDLCNKVLEILHSKALMGLSFTEFEKITSDCRSLFTIWEDQFNKFREVIRELARKRRQDDVPLRINVDNKQLQERIMNVRNFRKQHEELFEVIKRVLPADEGGKQSLEEMQSAYENVKVVDPLVMSRDGTETWKRAMKVYDEKIDKVETHIKEQLRDRLAMAKNANEMFRVFSKFNALFYRPRIRGAIQEYQTQLIERVKEDIKKLHERFKNKYVNSQASVMSNLRDLPPVSGAIIWARQIERQLKTYMRRVEDVLGKKWEIDIQGQQLKADFDQFRKKLNADHIFEQWVRETEARTFEVSGRILDIVKKGNNFTLDINFDPHIITLFKEVRNLTSLGYRVPFSITLLSSGGRQVYPFAVSLREIIQTYTQTCAKVLPEISLLVSAYKKEVQKLLEEGFRLRWEALSKLDGYVNQLYTAVQTFQEKVEDVRNKYSVIQLNMTALTQCALKEDVLKNHLNNIQKVVDDLNLANYSNLTAWVKNIDVEIKQILLDRTKLAIDSWVDVFQQNDRDDNKDNVKKSVNRDTTAFVIKRKPASREYEGKGSPRPEANADQNKPKIRPTVHEIIIRNQLMQLSPPLDFARSTLYAKFNDWLAILIGLPRIQSSRYDDGFSHRNKGDDSQTSYRDLLKHLPKGTLESAFTIIEKKLKEVRDYVQIWLQYQSLWDMEPSTVYSRLGDDLTKWQRLLHEIKRSRTTFDNTDTKKDFGPIVIRYGQVQANVNNKYDYWHKDILYNFGIRMGEAMKIFHSKISTMRIELESQSIETATTAEAVSFILKLQDIKKNLTKWEGDMDVFKAGQDLLTRQRFQFPSDWLEYDMVEGEWNAFNELINRKTTEINNEIPALQKKVLDEGKVIEERVKDLHNDWANKKPIGGNVEFATALDSLKIFEGRVGRLEEEINRVKMAKQALFLEDSGTDAAVQQLTPVSREILDLKNVWSELSDTWKAVNELKETLWSAVLPRKIRKYLEDLIQRLKTLPNRIRQYEAFHHVQKLVKAYLKGNTIISELRTDAIKERHWKLLQKKLGTKWIQSELTLGNIWDSDLVKNEAIYKEVITQAQGELALEEFMKELKEFWQAFELDLVNFRNKCQLIRGWDDLFAKVAENLNSLNAMKNSPYFKVFEEEAAGWEDKLNRIQALFDVWIDVQRRWVYLEAIFSGSNDIKNLLPQESSRFETINIEFLNLMKKVGKSRLILEVLTIEGIERTLERLADLLTKIQKALGDYLEKQRAAFPRFYFIGDEDLLEIIGNSKDILKIQKHLKKMFAGLSSLVLDDTQQIITGMSSAEGEVVPFKKNVVIKDYSSIDRWLDALEQEMKKTLAGLLQDAVKELEEAKANQKTHSDYCNAFLQWIDKYPAQLVTLGSQIIWSQTAEKALTTSDAKTGLKDLLELTESTLGVLAEQILQDLNAIKRKKLEHLITELVHQRDVTRQLIKQNITSATSFDWLNNMRFYWNHKEENLLKKLTIQVANASFFYGYEYLGVGEKLVQTPLTDRCYLTLTQALEWRMGGSPFGPAGTGKTETVKALGAQLGRFVLVFCCDEGFDFQAMSRIFVGLCQCGAWGCFDEFNRLEERILSAVSQQIQLIQVALKERASDVDLGKKVLINPDMAIFVTMNPNYAGRSNLPDNLKQLFRGIAMIQPDRELIAEVMLYSQGFKTAEVLASKIVPLFKLCEEQLSAQSHYDFGLRALKSVLVSAGNLKRMILKAAISAAAAEPTDNVSGEQGVLLRSVCETVIPKLVADDIPLFHSLLSDVFPGANIKQMEMEGLREQIKAICEKRHLLASDDWTEKLLQLYQIQAIRHGVMLVGPSGSGKSSAWTVLLEALEKHTKVKSESYVLDPKAITKDQLFGSLDPTTREWTDGLFTHLLRKIIDNVRGESERRHWIVFDGDVDPEWVENLNALLDDNKLLTLPNGERLALPDNVRIMFEVQDLKYATLATVSRCGMVWFNEETVTNQMLFQNYLLKLRHEPLDEQERTSMSEGAPIPPGLVVQQQIAEILAPYFVAGGLVERSLEQANRKEHIMDFTRLRALTSMYTLLNKGILNVIDNTILRSNLDLVQRYLPAQLLFSIMWGFGGSMALRERETFSRYICTLSSISTPDQSESSPPLLDYSIKFEDNCGWRLWNTYVAKVEIETHKVSSPDVVIPTIDTIRHVEVLKGWMSEHKPLILCGPPGSGKTMTLEDTLRALPDLELVSLNFSSATTPELILKTFEHHCEYKRTPKGTVLRPTVMGKWLVVFCDEINLPATDNYGTQRVITFIRQITEQGGFWRPSDNTWVRLEKINFVGACNPPTDPGRVPLTHRFLRHAPLLFVDFPSASSLIQIYGTFNRALLKQIPDLRAHADAITAAMVDFYTESQKKFTPDMQAHYIYSPRELSRWIRALNEGIQNWETASLDDLVRLFAHEALRLFQDRLVTLEERKWTDQALDDIIYKHFPQIEQSALRRPILYSTWMTKDYRPVERDALRDYVKARLRVFYEEELDVQLVLFNEVLDHILRIDRVFRQPQGHALLIGVSGGGKTVLSRFVAWMNGLSIFTIKVNNRYSAADFEEDLRTVMKRAGVKEEKICFIFDESNVLESSFLERMNTLLASGEVPGLFEGDEYTSLMHQIKETVQKRGLIVDSEAELYKWFIQRVRRNLHVVFTMNPANPDFHNRAATSPALFNRCVLDWFGEWSNEALFQVAQEFTNHTDLDAPLYKSPDFVPPFVLGLPVSQPLTHRDSVISSLVFIHGTIEDANVKLLKQQGRQNYVTPRHYLDFIQHFVTLSTEKRAELEEQQLHLNVGLQKLRDTEQKVKELQGSLAKKNAELEEKNAEANAKLKRMVEGQQAAEEKRKEGLALQEQLEKQKVEIAEQKAIAYEDLGKAEPALIDAQKSVKGIKKKHLEEIRAFARPPTLVKLTLEAVCLLLSGKKLDWNGIRKMIVEAGFISSIVEFDSKSVNEKLRESLRSEYLNQENFTFDAVNKASQACGPLVKWLEAQMSYSEILDKVKPLREKVEHLEVAAEEKAKKGEEVNAVIAELEQSISKYKEEYAMLITEVQEIKLEMGKVQAKVDRSIGLLTNLNSERARWESESAMFTNQMATVIGDSLLCAAFLAYNGFFDQNYRSMLMQKWTVHLESLNMSMKSDISVIDYLSHPDERLLWHANRLPPDNLCIENAIMLNRFNRYPLVIDPSGQASEYLMNQYKDKRITKTSFLDTSFMKNLESALRFGTPLLVEDVESIDPVLNPVLNKEIRKTGGRILIRLGDQDVDFSPSFCIFLSTRDPTSHFTPDLCSRVTFVNFTVTPSSLQSQCLDRVLQEEQPDIYQKRIDLVKLQGEFRVKLRKLEKLLLDALNESRGNILDDDKVMLTLETLKKEAADIQQRSEATDKIMDDIKKISEFYNRLALASSRIYFTLEQLAQLHFLYQFSLNYFLEVFYSIFQNNPSLAGVTDSSARLEILSKTLFSLIFKRVSRSLQQEDRLPLALRMAQVKLKNTRDELNDDLLEYLLRGGESTKIAEAGSDVELSAILNEDQRKHLLDLEDLELFSTVKQHIKANKDVWTKFLQSPVAETHVPLQAIKLEGSNIPTDSETINSFLSLLFLKAFRMDRFVAGATHFVSKVFGDHFLNVDFNFNEVVEKESNSRAPLLLCSTPGHDASSKVDEIAARMKQKDYKAIAIGSAEGFDLADKAINRAAQVGGWVLLKNTHLAPQWLVQLEKKLHSLKPHANFRLFLTSEIHPKLPANLLRLAHIFVFEPPAGIKASLLHTLTEVSQPRMDREPKERSRLYFLLFWFHSIIQERLRYIPFGWTKSFEFTDTDKRGALDTIDYWVDKVSQGRTNIDPDLIPWKAIRSLLAQTLYGGRIDNDFDTRLLDSFLEHLFTAHSFDLNFPLVDSVTLENGEKELQILAPEATNKAEFVAWTDRLSDLETPAWLGLPKNAELLRLQNYGKKTLAKVLKLQTVEEDSAIGMDVVDVGDDEGTTQGLERPAWIKNLEANCLKWLELLPNTVLESLPKNQDSLKNPLYRFFDREISIGRELMSKVKNDIQSLVSCCRGELKQSNYLRTLMTNLTKGVIPKAWKVYAVTDAATLNSWFIDFTLRIKQLQVIREQQISGAKEVVRVWLGGLFNPEAFITATRQRAARSRQWSLENLELSIVFDGAADSDGTSFIVEGLTLQGASLRDNKLQLSVNMSATLPATTFVWKNVIPTDQTASNTSSDATSIPVYLNESRAHLLFQVPIAAHASISPATLYQRGVAITTSKV